MRSELKEILLTEQWLLHQLNEDEAQNFEARLVSDQTFAENAEAQRLCYKMITHYARARERSQLDAVYRLLLKENDFAHQLNKIFS